MAVGFRITLVHKPTYQSTLMPSKLDNQYSLAYGLVGLTQLLDKSVNALDFTSNGVKGLNGKGLNTRLAELRTIKESLLKAKEVSSDLLKKTGMKNTVSEVMNIVAAEMRDKNNQTKALNSYHGHQEEQLNPVEMLKKDLRINSKSYDTPSSTKAMVISPRQTRAIDMSDVKERPAKRRATLVSNVEKYSSGKYPSIDIDVKGGTLTVMHSSICKTTIPLPDQGKSAYEIRELIIIVDDLLTRGIIKSWKQLVIDLHDCNWFQCSHPTFRKHINAYRENDTRDARTLPEPGRFQPRRGRKRKVSVIDSLKQNDNIHMNQSLVTDPIQDSIELIKKTNKSNYCIPGSDNASRDTIRRVANLGIYLGKDEISLVNLLNTRLKSEAREVASLSLRTLATHVLGIVSSQFRVGKWSNKPGNLSDGAEEMVKLAQHALGCTEVYPIDMRFILCYDEHGYRYTRSKTGRRYQIMKIGKTSTISTNSKRRDQKKHSSDYRPAGDSDNPFDAVTVKEKDVNCAAGHRGRKVLHFPNLSLEECPNGIVIVKVPGLGHGQDFRPGPDEFGYVIFSSSKADSDDFDKSDFSINMMISHFLIHKQVLPFVDDLRKGDANLKWNGEGHAILDMHDAVFKLDSDIPTLSVLRHGENVAEFQNKKIRVSKTAAGFTECGSSNDRQQSYKNVKRIQEVSSCMSDKTQLKTIITGVIAKCHNLGHLKFSDKKRETIIDCISINNLIDDKSYTSRETVQNGYVLTGEISRTRDGNGYNSCPDLYAALDCTKNESINKMKFIKSLYGIAKLFHKKGSLDESDFDSIIDENGCNLFPKDNLHGKEIPRIFTTKQYHLMRTMLPHHPYWVAKEHDERMVIQEKRFSSMMNKYSDALKAFEENSAAEDILKKRSLSGLLSECTVAAFNFLKVQQLRAFIRVRKSHDIYDSSYKMPAKKGKVEDVDSPLTSSTTLLELAFRLRAEPIKALQPVQPTQYSVESLTIPTACIPHCNVIDCSDKFEFFELNEEWISIVNHVIKNDFKTDRLTIRELVDPTCADVFRNRIFCHLKKFGLNHIDPHWAFILNNCDRLSVLWKLLGYVRDDESLRSAASHEHLFHPDFITNHELHQQANSCQHGCYLVRDSKSGYFIRAGSASSKLGHIDATGPNRGRINEHLASSKRPMESKSAFYKSYPHKDVEGLVRNKKGNFQQLQFVAVIRFEDKDKGKVQSLFEWNKEILDYLDKRKPNGCETLEDKKHRLVCYALETTMQMCLEPSKNISNNPGCEAFALVFDRSYDDEEMDFLQETVTNTIAITEVD